ncbi:MAG: WecB/TagA/CpsF family glycosyltransferase [Actinobacteria bacterium]|nr:WecB/TagA/CpsF family glycosyltransferase [Actinomycetota bacterium]
MRADRAGLGSWYGEILTENRLGHAPARVPTPSYRVLGTSIAAVDPARAVAHVEGMVRSRSRGTIAFCTASTVLAARRDPDLRRALTNSSLVNPDGMPLVWLGRRAGVELDRVYGPDFMLDLFAATGSSLRHYFYGGTPGVVDALVEQLSERFPEIQIVGSHTPEFGLTGRDVIEADVARINAAAPDIVWIGLGHPKQELWMETHVAKLDASVLAGVGAAFDYLSGTKKEAPEWMKRSGLQWMHRLGSEPRRLWKRYLVGNSTFVALLVAEWVRTGRMAHVD